MMIGQSIQRAMCEQYILKEQPVDFKDIEAFLTANGLDPSNRTVDYFTHEQLLEKMIGDGQRRYIFRYGSRKELGHSFSYDEITGQFKDWTSGNMDYMPKDNGVFKFAWWDI